MSTTFTTYITDTTDIIAYVTMQQANDFLSLAGKVKADLETIETMRSSIVCDNIPECFIVVCGHLNERIISNLWEAKPLLDSLLKKIETNNAL